jgi:hypothetical protein
VTEGDPYARAAGRALVVGMSGPTGLAVVRALARSGIRVSAVQSAVCECAAQSKVLKASHVGLCLAVSGREWPSCRHCGGSEVQRHGGPEQSQPLLTHPGLRLQPARTPQRLWTINNTSPRGFLPQSRVLPDEHRQHRLQRIELKVHHLDTMTAQQRGEALEGIAFANHNPALAGRLVRYSRPR